MYQKTVVQVKQNKKLSKAIADIVEAQKDPEFRKFIRAFVKYHTGSK